jgi:predicted metal-dependent enzyme (double-stranded beta helix superfamily)
VAVAPPDAPVRALLDAIAEPAGRPVPDLDAIGAALLELTADTAYLDRWVRDLGNTSGMVRIHAPERGPRLMLVHRLEGQMGAVHDHRVWVALAAVSGLETHRRYRRPAADDAMPEVAETVEVAPREVVTLLPPEDIHDHGHIAGRGAPAYCLILSGDDQRRYERTEWDLASGRRRVLLPGEGGRWVSSEPFPGA